MIEEDAQIVPMPFADWYKEKLKVVGYPVLKDAIDGDYKDYDVFINVSDEYWMDYQKEFWKMGKQNHWFPMGEMSNDIGLISIFAALQVMYQAHQRNLSVLLHCHAGVNRSQTVRACYHYMMDTTHVPEPNMLIRNCRREYLMPLEKMEKWLRACRKAFDNPDRFLGGMYDWTITACNDANFEK